MYGCFILGLISQIIVVQNLSAPSYGKFAIIIMVASLIQMPINLHSGEIFLRYSKPMSISLPFKRKINLLEIKLFLFGSFLLMLVLYFMYDLSFNSVGTYFVLALLLPSQYSFAVTKVMFTISDNMEKLSGIELLFNLLKVAIYFFTSMSGGLEFLLLGHLLFLSSKSVIMIVASKSLSINYDENDIKINKKYSITSLVRSFLQQGSSNADLIIVSLFMKLETVAVYKVAKVICQSIFVSQQPIWRALQPKLYQSFKLEDPSVGYMGFINQGIFRSIMFFIPVFLILYLFGDQIIIYLYGSYYASAISIIKVLLFGILFYNMFVGWFKVWAINTENLILPLLTYSTIIASYAILPIIIDVSNVISLTYLFTLVNLIVFIFLYMHIRGEHKTYLLHS